MYMYMHYKYTMYICVFINVNKNASTNFLQEQNYIPHVMAYSACIGPYAGPCEHKPRPGTSVGGASSVNPHMTVFVLLTLVLKML